MKIFELNDQYAKIRLENFKTRKKEEKGMLNEKHLLESRSFYKKYLRVLVDEISLRLMPGGYMDAKAFLEIEISGIPVELNYLIAIAKCQHRYSLTDDGNVYMA